MLEQPARHLPGHPLPAEGQRCAARGDRHRGRQARCRRGAARSAARGARGERGAAAGQVSAGRREDADQGAARAHGAGRRTALRRGRAHRQRRHLCRDRPPAAARAGHPGTRGDDHRARSAPARQLPHPDRHAAALRPRARRRQRRAEYGVPRRADDGAGAGESRHTDHQGHLGLRRLHARGNGPAAASSTRASTAATACRRARCSQSLRPRPPRAQGTLRGHGRRHASCSTASNAAACSFVCPAHIPLVQSFRVAKNAVRRKRAAP